MDEARREYHVDRRKGGCASPHGIGKLKEEASGGGNTGQGEADTDPYVPVFFGCEAKVKGKAPVDFFREIGCGNGRTRRLPDMSAASATDENRPTTAPTASAAAWKRTIIFSSSAGK